MNTVTIIGGDYGEILIRQQKVFNSLIAKKRRGESVSGADELLMLVEHRHIYTLGRHGNPSNLLDSRWLASRGIPMVNISRGGDITYHGPGQVVAYPVVDLQRRRLGVKAYVSLLEDAVIRTIAEYGIRGERIDGASGVWIGKGTNAERKICAIGISCSRFVSMHGLALNVSTDLSYFSAINPCGFTDRGVTSVSRELGRDVGFAECADSLRRHLEKLLAV